MPWLDVCECAEGSMNICYCPVHVAYEREHMCAWVLLLMYITL